MRQFLQTVLERPMTRNFILGVIVFNAALMGLETSSQIMTQFSGLIQWLDRACIAIFIVEIVAKLIVQRGQFFRDGWNVFDFLIVSVALIPAAQSFSVLRALRVLRVFRVLSAAPRLRRVVEGFVTALPGMASVFLLMAIIFYISSVMATNLFGQAFPDWFGNLGRSAYSLFQIMTLESWSMGIVRPVMELYPLAWAFFVPFILATTFAVVNLLVGLIVNSMASAHSEEEDARTDDYRDQVLERLSAIETRLSEAQGKNSTTK
nr:ion transporter [Amylibacter marinus]